MNCKTVFLLLILFVASPASAQSPDLIIPSGSFTPTTLKAGEILTINAAVKNRGNLPSGNSHLGFWVSPTTNPQDAIFLGSVSVEPLGPGTTSEEKSYVFALPEYFTPGNYFIGFCADYYYEVSESDESNIFYLPGQQLTVTNGLVVSRHIPYPIILIHGWNSSDKIWNSLSSWLSGYGWSNGGIMNFCLNEDGALTTGSLSADYRDFSDTINLKAADFYFVNFDVDPDGSVYNNTVESNQSAAVKQGRATHDAVRHVLDVTGSEKVILVGHSMGGLAAREYLQDTSKWQLDVQHHTAMLLTIGTPHGGSNQPTFGIGDGYSEAVRDLRWSYSNGANGIYLFGGNENDKGTIGFHNVDVNCNGSVGDNIVGLNQKNIPSHTQVAYSCVIGTAGVTGDGIVDAYRANLNNYYSFSIPADTFLVNAWHSEALAQFFGGDYETGRHDVCMKGLDEPASFTQSYDIGFDSLYFGLITEQSKGTALYPDTTDYDDYKFTIRSSGSLHINIKDIPVSYFKVEVFDSMYNSKLAVYSNSLSQIDTITHINAGVYYLKISGLADKYSWEFPYAFKLGFNPATSVENTADLIPNQYSLHLNYPNPFNPSTVISYELPEQSFVSIKVFNILGQEVSQIIGNLRQEAGKYSVTFDGSGLSSGVYFYRMMAMNKHGTFVQTNKMTLLR